MCSFTLFALYGTSALNSLVMIHIKHSQEGFRRISVNYKLPAISYCAAILINHFVLLVQKTNDLMTPCPIFCISIGTATSYVRSVCEGWWMLSTSYFPQWGILLLLSVFEFEYY